MKCFNCHSEERAEILEERDGVLFRQCPSCEAWARSMEDLSLSGRPRARMEPADDVPDDVGS